jgi:hypothetical protein
MSVFQTIPIFGPERNTGFTSYAIHIISNHFASGSATIAILPASFQMMMMMMMIMW